LPAIPRTRSRMPVASTMLLFLKPDRLARVRVGVLAVRDRLVAPFQSIFETRPGRPARPRVRPPSTSSTSPDREDRPCRFGTVLLNRVQDHSDRLPAATPKTVTTRVSLAEVIAIQPGTACLPELALFGPRTLERKPRRPGPERCPLIHWLPGALAARVAGEGRDRCGCSPRTKVTVLGVASAPSAGPLAIITVNGDQISAGGGRRLARPSPAIPISPSHGQRQRPARRPVA
jgi:hypothetical protein